MGGGSAAGIVHVACRVGAGRCLVGRSDVPKVPLPPCAQRADRAMPFNPMEVARYRERWTVAHSKSDHADAMVLANILRTDRPRIIACPRIANSPKRRGARALSRTPLAPHKGGAGSPCHVREYSPDSSRPSPQLASPTWPARTPRATGRHRADTSRRRQPHASLALPARQFLLILVTLGEVVHILRDHHTASIPCTRRPGAMASSRLRAEEDPHPHRM